jgi:predicted phage-related endonuclease
MQHAHASSKVEPPPMLAGSDHAFRQTVVGASEVAALFDACPWLTRFELFHRKAGTIATPDFGGNERIEAGIYMEPSIIKWACDRWGYEPLRTPKRYDNDKGLGGHPDQIVKCPERGIGVLEVKTVDWLQHKKWGDEPPLNYLLQNQAYQGLAGVSWGDVIVLVGGNQLVRHQYAFRPALYAEIEKRVAAFWDDVSAGRVPPVDYARDGATLIDVLGEPSDEVADLRHDNNADELAREYLSLKATAKYADDEAEKVKCQLIERIGTAGYAMLPTHKIGANQTKGSAGILVTAEHVGTTIGARKGYRRFDVKEL